MGSGGSTRYAVYATAYPAIEPCVLHLTRLERAVTRTSRFTCLPHGHHRLDRRDTSHAGQAHKQILPIERTRGYSCGGVIFVYIVVRLININIAVRASYIRIVLHAIFQLCTPTSTA